MENFPRKVEGGLDYWNKELSAGGYTAQLRPFNDVLTGKDAPQGYGEAV